MPIVVEGIVGLRKALKEYAPELRKELDKQVVEAIRPIIEDARSKVPDTWPLRNWNAPGYERKSRTSRARAFPSFDAGVVRKGLVYSLGQQRNSRTGFVSMYTLINKSAAGGIIETAGRRSGSDGSSESKSNNKDAGSRFVLSMNRVGALKDFAGKGQMTTGRLLYAAYDRNNGKALDAIMKAIDITLNKLADKADKYHYLQKAA